jgi:hypothetical protein
MSEKAWRMLKHMQKQIFRHPAPYVVVQGAAFSIGVDPGGSECEGLDRCTRLMDTGRPISFTSSRQANDRLFNHSVHLSSR